MIMLYTLIAPGMSSAQNVFTIPRLFTSRYVGIRPPPKNIVNTNRNTKKPRIGISRRESGYAHRTVTTTLISVPPSV